MSTKSKLQLQQELSKLQEAKDKLVKAKNDTPEKFTTGMQTKLDEITEAIVDLEEQIELAPDYTPAKGTEKCVHLKIVNGRRFNPRTGKEESAPYIQIFTPNEYNLFKQYHALIGFQVVEVLHDPTNTAKELISK